MSAEERYQAGFNGRVTMDVLDEIMMEAQHSISLSQQTESNNNNHPFHTKQQSNIASNVAPNVYSMDKISTFESLKMVWKIVVQQLIIGICISFIIIFVLWILIKYIFKLNNCDSYNNVLSFKMFAIQCINS
eukprot:389963_1